MNHQKIQFRPLLLSALITALLAGCSTSKTENAQSNESQPKTEQAEQKEQLATTDAAKAGQPPQAKPAPEAELAKVDIRGAVVTKPQEPAYMETAVVADTALHTNLPPSGARHKRIKQFSYSGYAQPAPYIQEQNTENYADEKINPVYSVDTDPVSTFSVDVDTASYTNVRRFLNQGQWPAEGAVRVEEMINYFNYQYPQPQSSDTPFAVSTEIAPSPWNSNTQLMRVALKGYQNEKADLPPMNLVFLLDVSGSMHSPNKLPLLKRSFNLLTRQLRAQDTVSIVVYAGASGVVLEPTKGDKQAQIEAALHKLQAGGSTNGGAGIELAYATAKANFNKEGINRVILASDGDFNVGTTDINQLKKLVEREKKSGVFLSILGFGQGNYNDQLTEDLSNIGNGNAFYIDSFKEARKVFSDGLTGTLQTIAKDVKIQVEFNPAYVAEYRLIGYDNRQLKREDFKNDKVDAGDIGAGHTVTAFYEVVMKDASYRFNDPLRYQNQEEKTAQGERNNELAYVKLRYKAPDGDKSKLLERPVLVSDVKGQFNQASSEFQFATAVAAFGEKLRDSQYVDYSFKQIKQIAKANLGADPWGYRHEFVQLTDNAMVLKTANH